MKKHFVLIVLFLQCISGSLWCSSLSTTVTLEVDALKFIQLTANGKDDVFFKVIAATETSPAKEPVVEIFVRQFQKIAVAQGKKLADYFTLTEGDTDDQSITSALRSEIEEAADRAIEIIRQRIVQSGFGEPTIRKLSPYRVSMGIPKTIDTTTVQVLLADARLEFRLFQDGGIVREVFDRIDRHLAGFPKEFIYDDSISYVGLTEEEKVAKFEREHPFSRILFRGATDDGRIYAVDADHQALLKILTRHDVRPLYEDKLSIKFSRPNRYDLEKFYEVYFLEPTPELTGGFVDYTASNSRDGRHTVLIHMDKEGARIWSRITGENIGKPMAIMVDNVVYSAPTIQDQIDGGIVEISGVKDSQEAKLLALLIEVGGLPVSMKIVGE